jgi:glutathione synthase/RimK-type ligase-like ATP-grasp enzyme
MKVGILKPFRGQYRSMLNVYEQILNYNKIDYEYLDINDPSFWNKVKKVDLFIAKISQTDDDLNLAQQIWPVINDYLKINCFPNQSTLWHYDDKVKQYYLLSQFDFPIVESYIFWDEQIALDWLKTAKFPVVFKLKGGAGSSNVSLIKSKRKAEKLIKKAFRKGIHPQYHDLKGKLKAYNYNVKKIFKVFAKPFYNKYIKKLNAYNNYTRQKNYVYFQKFMAGNEYDTRIAIVGKRAYAFKRFVRPNDFRASGSDNYDMRKDQIDMRMVEIGFQISEKLNFQSMAYDFVYDDLKNPLVIEISYTYGDYPEFSDGFWDQNLVWHDGNYVPEYLELVDSLNMPELRQPPDIKLDSPYTKANMVN